MNFTFMHLGLKIKMMRMSKGLSQQDLADQIHKTRPLISHIEQTGKVNSYTLNKICKVLNIDRNQLENIANDDGNQYRTLKEKEEHYQREINLLNEEIKILKDLVQSQKDLIAAQKEQLMLLKSRKK